MSQRILVVDDDQEIVRIIRAYLEKAGYVVLTAFDGERALHIIRIDRPDLIVLDLMLPDRDGWNITRVIRADEALAKTPIVMLTARVESGDKIMGLDIGADDYITKPFNPNEVVSRVRAVLHRSTGDPVQAHVIQLGGLLCDIDRYEVPVAASEEEIQAKALATEGAHRFMEGKPAKKIVYVAGKLVSIVV